MDRFANANLISLFDFYLASMFVVSSYRRRGIYWDGIKLTFATSRKRKLLGKVHQHRDALFTYEVMRAMFMAFSLVTIQWLCSRVIYPEAVLTFRQVAETWWQPILLIASAIPMLCVDMYFLLRIGQFDRTETEKYLDQAENWLGWRARAVRIATIGIMNPRTIVDKEVRSALQILGQTVGWVMWWMSIQIICRVTFGLSIWLFWAFH